MAFIYNWVEDKVAGYAKTGIQAGGTLAGNTVGSVGGLVENSGNSVAKGVTGSIGGVANYINGYGDKIQRSFSSDSALAAKDKPAAQPSTAAGKKPPAAPKALPAAAQKKALPAPAAKPKSPAPAVGGAAKRPTASTRQVGPTAKPAGVKPPPPKPLGGTQANKLVSTPSQSQSGKVVISPASRPKPKTAAAGRGPTKAPTAKPKDPLGIESGSKGMGGKPAGNARKPTGADPLAIGKDFGSFGKK